MLQDPLDPSRTLDRAGVVAFSSCGHWWFYPGRANVARMHDVARFNLITVCSFCESERLRCVSTRAFVPTSRLN